MVVNDLGGSFKGEGKSSKVGLLQQTKPKMTELIAMCRQLMSLSMKFAQRAAKLSQIMTASRMAKTSLKLPSKNMGE